jgi:hypothetical protein
VQNYPVFTAPLNANINEISNLIGEVLFLQNGKESSITWKGMKNIEKVESLRRELAPHIRFLRKQVEKIEKSKQIREELVLKSKEYFALS